MKLINYNCSPRSRSNGLNRLFGFRNSAIEHFGDLFDGFWNDESDSNQLAVDFYEDDESFFARMELPGVKKDAINLEIVNGVLTCSVNYSEKNKSGKADYSFKRSITLPEEAASDQVSADFKNGILIVKIARKEIPEARRIKVK